MLIISKPVRFGSDGQAVRDQCQMHSPGWQLRWFAKNGDLTAVWDGAFKTCRHIQSICQDVSNLDSVRERIKVILEAEKSFIEPGPTEEYSSVDGTGFSGGDSENGKGVTKKKKKKKRR